MEQVWNYGYVGDDVRTVDVTVRRLREKIEDDPASPRYILTRRGVGYYYSTLVILHPFRAEGRLLPCSARLHMKLVLIMLLLVTSLMAVVGAFLMTSVTNFYIDDFY